MSKELQQQTAGTVADRLVRLPEVRHLTGLAKTSIYDGVKAGTFPPAVRVTDYAVAWRQSEIEAWIASRPSAAEPPKTTPSAKATTRASRQAATKPIATTQGNATHRATTVNTKHAAPKARKAHA